MTKQELMEKIQAQDPETLAEIERREDYFLGKKGIKHLKDTMKSKVDAIAKVCEKEGINFEDFMQNKAPAHILEMKQAIEKQHFINSNAIRYAYEKAIKEGELEKFDEEYRNHESGIKKQETDQKSYDEAMKKYEITGDKRAFAEMLKSKNLIPDPDINGYTKSDKDLMRETENQMRERISGERNHDNENLDSYIKELKSSESPKLKREAEFLEKQKIKEETLRTLENQEA